MKKQFARVFAVLAAAAILILGIILGSRETQIP